MHCFGRKEGASRYDKPLRKEASALLEIKEEEIKSGRYLEKAKRFIHWRNPTDCIVKLYKEPHT